jgi:hypothetical protein
MCSSLKCFLCLQGKWLCSTRLFARGMPFPKTNVLNWTLSYVP